MNTRTPARRTDRASLEIAASPARLYAAFADPVALAKWLPPNTMTGRVLEYDFREGGRYRIALDLRDNEPGIRGKTEERTDITQGRFVSLVTNERIVQAGEFESSDDAFGGEMIMTWTFEPTSTGTKVTITAENVPPGISEADHSDGLRSTLENLARHVQ